MANNGWGGKRENQTGRPKGTKKEIAKTESLYVRCTVEQKNELKRLAEDAGLSVSSYILQRMLP